MKTKSIIQLAGVLAIAFCAVLGGGCGEKEVKVRSKTIAQGTYYTKIQLEIAYSSGFTDGILVGSKIARNAYTNEIQPFLEADACQSNYMAQFP
jgi:hypothetical protein